MKTKVLILFGISLVTIIGFAQVPNTFNPGDTLSSSKLNENFKYVSKVVKDATGATLGQYMGFTSENVGCCNTTNKVVRVMNKSGYLFGVNMATGRIGTLEVVDNNAYYLDAGCITPIFVTSDANSINGVVFDYKETDTLVPITTDYGLFYISQNAVPNTTSGSYYTKFTKGGTCSGPFTVAGSGLGFYSASPNNATVTGVTKASYTLPIKIVSE